MATFMLLHGAGGRAGDWDLLRAELEALGHRTRAVDLPADDDTAGLADHVAAVVDALPDAPPDLVLVAQSMAGLIAPLVCTQVRVDLLVLLAAMVPTAGETGGEWWANTGHAEAVAAQGLPDDTTETLFLHDVPAHVLAGLDPPRDQSGTLFDEPWPLASWPAVPTHALVGGDDRFFPPDWLAALVAERVGVEAEVIPGGHCAYLSQPAALADALHRAWRTHAR
jgi:pimeloyl-ACP methyl ester carboxylesterase